MVAWGSFLQMKLKMHSVEELAYSIEVLKGKLLILYGRYSLSHINIINVPSVENMHCGLGLGGFQVK